MPSKVSYDVRITQIVWNNRIFTFDIETDAKKWSLAQKWDIDKKSTILTQSVRNLVKLPEY